MEQFKTKKENVLLLLQYLEEIRNTNGGGYAGTFRSLCKTFEINNSDYSQLLRVLKKDKFVIALGTKIKPIYKFVRINPPTLAQAGKILDDIYKTRRGYQIDRRAKKKFEKTSGAVKTIIKPVEKHYEVRTLKTYVLNVLRYIEDQTITNGSTGRSLAELLKAYHFDRYEQPYFVKHLYSLGYVKLLNKGRAHQLAYSFAGELEAKNLKPLYDMVEDEMLKRAEKKREYKLKYLEKSKTRYEEALEWVGQNAGFQPVDLATYPGKKSLSIEVKDEGATLREKLSNTIKFPTLQVIDELIEVMSKIMMPSQLVFDEDFGKKFDEESRLKLGIVGTDYEIDLTRYKGLEIVHSLSSSQPIQII